MKLRIYNYYSRTRMLTLLSYNMFKIKVKNIIINYDINYVDIAYIINS